MNIYFIGIGGIGVSALANFYLEKKHNIFGSDLCESEITKALKKKKARVFIGDHKSQTVLKNIDLLIYTQATCKSNNLLKEAKKRKIRTLSYPQALGELSKEYFTIAVSGSHGKSTTTSMISLILLEAGLDPNIIVGTKLKELNNANFKTGKSKYLVIEACEYKDSFLNYNPDISVILNIEKEHLDYFKDIRGIKKSFQKFADQSKKLVLNKDDKNASKIRAKEAMYFSLKEKRILRNVLKIPGDHNISNALAAFKTAKMLKIKDEDILKALSKYTGSWRRFEIVQKNNFTVINDYAHHPSEIAATLSAAREKYKKEDILCVFQPHQYQRTFYLFNDFKKAFKKAIREKKINELVLTDIYDVKGREENKIKSKISSEKLKDEIKENAKYIPSLDEVLKYIKKRKNQIVILMGAGDIYDLNSRLK